jgi:hypothetical protein
MRMTQALAVLSMLAAPLAAQAGERVLEMDPKASAVARPPAVCDVYHEISPVACRYWHVIAVTPIPALKEGAVFTAENESGKETFTVVWTGANLYLENGEVMLARGSNEGSLSSVTDVATQQSRAVTGWSDNDKDGTLSAGDGIGLNGKDAKILEMRTVMGVTD